MLRGRFGRERSFKSLVDDYCVPHTIKNKIVKLANDLPQSKQLTYPTLFANVVKEYARVKTDYKSDSPILLKEKIKKTNSEEFLRNYSVDLATYLDEGRRLKVLGDDLPESIRPVLHYYSHTMTYAFFCNAFFWFDRMHQGHGLAMHYNSDVKETSFVIEKAGKFARIVDSYCLLGYRGHFVPLEFDNRQLVPTSNELSYLKHPTVRLSDFINMIRKWDSGNRDLADYILLFVASNLARYRPHQWKEIVAGQKTDLIRNFRFSFARMDTLHKRLVFAVEAGQWQYITNIMRANDSDIENQR